MGGRSFERRVSTQRQRFGGDSTTIGRVGFRRGASNPLGSRSRFRASKAEIAWLTSSPTPPLNWNTKARPSGTPKEAPPLPSFSIRSRSWDRSDSDATGRLCVDRRPASLVFGDRLSLLHRVPISARIGPGRPYSTRCARPGCLEGPLAVNALRNSLTRCCDIT